MCDLFHSKAPFADLRSCLMHKARGIFTAWCRHIAVFALPWEASVLLKIVVVGKGLLDSLLWGTPCSLLSPYVTGVVLY